MNRPLGFGAEKVSKFVFSKEYKTIAPPKELVRTSNAKNVLQNPLQSVNFLRRYTYISVGRSS